jgi:ABC-type branched-subunit amino acid transport system substrate-binding protein
LVLKSHKRARVRRATYKGRLERGRSVEMRLKVAILGLVAAALFAGGVSASSSSKDAPAPYHIAIITFRTSFSDLLTEFQAGANAAAKALNAKGGIGGHRVIIDACNTQFTTAGSTACAHQALANHAIVSIGCDLSWGAGGIPLFEAAKVPSINCPNTSVDYNDPWSFGLNASAIGQQRAAARYVCSRPEIHKAAVVGPDISSLRTGSFRLSALLLKACGKEGVSVFYPLTAVDVTPYVNQVAQSKPDFVLFSGIGAQVVLFYRAFQANGIPPSHVSAPDTDFVYDIQLKTAGSAMEGGIALNQFKSWGLTSDPEVKAYLAAMKGSPVDARSATCTWGYFDVMAVATAAKAIGYSKFNSVTLQKFLSTNNGTHIPLGRSLSNPGPKKFPQMKHPYIQLTQWKGGKMVVMRVGAKKDGWIYGY